MNYFGVMFAAVCMAFIIYAAWQHQTWKREKVSNDDLQREVDRICNREARR